jgi:two-component system, OmpR family, phosphate regulon sensor histidine kinase PhoR
MSSPIGLSLYELVAQSQLTGSTLQISPTTLKSVSDSMVNLLIEQNISALVWAKLPRGEVWWTALERYANLKDVPRGLYWFKNQREDNDDAQENTRLDQSPLATTIAANPTPLFATHLDSDHALKQDYFLIVQSDRFCGAVIAQRLPADLPPKLNLSDTAALEMLSSYGQPSQLVEAAGTSERKQPLAAFCSFDAVFVRRMLSGLEGAIAHLPEFIAHWQPLMGDQSAQTTQATDLDLLTQLFSRQLQQQEDLWQRNSTYRKQSETAESLRLQNEELTNTIRLKDDFLNNVGQELRTPLTTIKTALSLLSSPSIKPPQRQRYMDLIAKECDRQSSLITSLLDLVHLEQVTEQSALPACQISDVVPGVVSTYLPLAEEKSVRLGYTMPDNLPPVSCLSNWLKQIAINLLHNGIKFTPAGGQVWVRTKQQGDYVQLEVSDTGIGIAQSEIPKIFDRFYRVRQAADDSGGAGLGLTIVQHLLLQCGGSISVKSRQGEGTTFNVLLPIHRNSSEPMI